MGERLLTRRPKGAGTSWRQTTAGVRTKNIRTKVRREETDKGENRTHGRTRTTAARRIAETTKRREKKEKSRKKQKQKWKKK
ncbi:hypothetical protein AB0I49_34295 [Streptomyces sp. NPDC050617]|uniref:hypothetical protein n=1 Tax=Streptomyces sp. NPDC050617 TaxID=3154628 RepID=UPI0034470786